MPSLRYLFGLRKKIHYSKQEPQTPAKCEEEQKPETAEFTNPAPVIHNLKLPPLPVEIILQILHYLDVPSFLAASTISRAWNFSSSELVSLRDLLGRAGWSTDESIMKSTDIQYVKRRLYLENELGTFNPGRANLNLSSITDTTKLVSTKIISNITTSTCQRFCMICAEDKVSF